jgi:putative RNA 2'-phosphotransferase
VHLSDDEETAGAVGRRYGRTVVLTIAGGRMQGGGHMFFRSANGVWLTGYVPVEFIIFPDAGR